MATQGVASSSSSTRWWTYDVFLSFRGEDTRDNFTAHLYHALRMKGINAFIDDDELKRGEEISQALLKAIEVSRISIVVFSQTYASSKWCLDELMKIVETEGQTVLPVFYKVDPSDVRHQKNSYGEALAKHAERFNDDEKVEKWKSTLTQVANLSGWLSKNYMNEAKFIEELVHEVSKIVNQIYFHIANHPVGINFRVQEINSLLSIDQTNDIRMIGILGSGGIGKTSIAKAIYNLIAYHFEGSCFLANVRETCLVKLQNTLLSKILGHTVEVDSVDEGITVIKKRLCSKRILLILDDVDQLVQLDKLAGEVDWFGLGSRIIITTRDSKVLTSHGVVDDLIYKVEELDSNEALELFCWNAFKEDKPPDDFLKLVKDAISYVGGLPLALEVLGSYLHRKDIHKWKSALNKYKSIPPEEILKRLRISYDGLHPNDQNLFLDIACFFIRRWKADDIKKLDSSYYSTIDGIDVLIERSLITIHGNVLEMHNLLRDMGREVVRQESPDDLGKRSRLWFHEDVRQVLEDDMGTNKIQSILVDLPEGEDMDDLSSKAFEKMRSLRLLMVTPNARFSAGLNFLPNTLRVIDWPNCPLEFLPPNFRGINLNVLRMPWSPLKELKAIKNFQSMKIMDFSYCEFLKRFPDVSTIPNLEELKFDGCTNLVEVHPSVGFLDKLVNLSLKECYNLGSFPRSLKLRSLNCFANTGMKELPSSIAYLIGLGILDLHGNKNLVLLPSSISQLQKGALPDLYLHDSVLLESSFFSIFNCFPKLQLLNLSETTIVTIPACIERFVCLANLYLHDCKQLRKIPRLPPNIKDVSAEGCMSLETFFEEPQTSQLLNTWLLPELELVWYETTCSARGPVGSGAPSATYQNVQTVAIAHPLRGLYHEHRYFNYSVSGNKIPDWFNYQKKVSNSNSCEIDIDEAADMFGEFTIIAFSAVVGMGDVGEEVFGLDKISAYVITRGVELYRVDASKSLSASYYVWLHLCVPQYSFKLPSVDHVRVKFEVTELSHFKSCGFHLVRQCNENEIDLIDGIQLKKRPRDDGDGNLESNWCPQQKRHSSTLGFTFSNAEDAPPGEP